MGQYYKICRLASNKKNYPNKEKVIEYIEAWDYDNGAKQMEFGFLYNNFMGVLEILINKKDGTWAGSPIIIAGDYADAEPLTLDKKEVTIYSLCKYGKRLKNVPDNHYRYFINEDKKVFIDGLKIQGDANGCRIHPLAILLADGSGRGCGDYEGINKELGGTWKRDVVVTSDIRPDETYQEVSFEFVED